MKTYRILTVNPGSTSTKIAVFENDREIFSQNVNHDAAKLKEFASVQDQLQYRKQTVEEALVTASINLTDIDLFVGRGGGLVAVEGGTYLVTPRLLQDASTGMAGQHPAQLGSQICDLFVQEYGGEAYIVNPPDTDEYDDISRVSGLADIVRECHVHALNQKEVALRYCAANNLKYREINLILAHIGGGISVTAHRGGRMVDSNDIIKGEGPMAPTRAGALPTMELATMCYSGTYTEKELKDRLLKNGGLVDHLGTSDAREIEKRIEAGDAYAKLIYDAMLYQVAKEIGSRSVACKGDVTAIILTGGMSNSPYVCDFIEGYVAWIAPVVEMAGEFEMEALAAGALRVKQGEEEAKTYTGVPVWSGFKTE